MNNKVERAEPVSKGFLPEHLPAVLVGAPFFLGLLLFLSGIVFFFAFNWQGLDRLSKLAVAGTPFLLAAVILLLCLLFTRSNASFWAALLAGCSIAIPLALYGQVYQSTADSWLLFALWAVFGAPFFLLKQFAPGYVAWALLLMLALFLYVDQNLDRRVWSSDLSWAFASAFAVVLFLVFFLINSKLHFAAGDWPARLFAMLAILPAWLITFMHLLGKRDSTEISLAVYLGNFIFFATSTGMIFYFIRKISFDFFYVSIPVYLLSLLPPALMLPNVFDRNAGAGSLFMVFILFAILTTVATVALLSLRRRGGL